jgi:hypothetical protein
MIVRKKLPNRRASLTFPVEVHGLRFTASASQFANGSLGELFLVNHKVGSGAGILASDAAIAASLALQYGCPFETLRRALCRDARGKASSPLGAALDVLADDERGAS